MEIEALHFPPSNLLWTYLDSMLPGSRNKEAHNGAKVFWPSRLASRILVDQERNTLNRLDITWQHNVHVRSRGPEYFIVTLLLLLMSTQRICVLIYNKVT